MTGIRIATLCLLSFVVLDVATAQQLSDEELGRRLNEGVPRLLQRTATPSASIAIVRDGRIALVKAYGNARLGPDVLATRVTRYPIGSISKQFTAAAILLLAQEGKLGLDDHIGRFLPQVPHASEVTIRQLLSHSAGYRDDLPDNFVPPWMYKATTPAQLLTRFASGSLDFVPGTRFEYSNTDYVLAAMIIERASGHGLNEFLTAHIFRPVQMESAGSLGERAPDAAGYVRYAFGPPRSAPPQTTGWLFGGGELVMTAEDLARWDISVIDQSLMSPASYRELETEQRLANGLGTGYALGLRLSTLRGHRKLEHAGEVSGYYAENIVLPDDKSAVVVLTNLELSTCAVEIANNIVDLLLPRSEQPRAALDRVRQTLAALQHGEIDRGNFTSDANAYFNAAVLHDYAVSLAPLGTILNLQANEPSARAGQRFVNYTVRFTSGLVLVRTAADESGKFAQFLVEPGE